MSSQQLNYRRPSDDRTLGYRKMITTSILAIALLGFEIFNFSTTAYALDDLLGSLSFLGMRWSTVLAIAFCAIDFAGIARLFLPEAEQEVPRELWFLFGAWLLAATMNAALTWWGISMAVVNRTLVSSSVINPQVLVHVIPVFVAILVWVTRILLIGSFSLSVKSASIQEVQSQAAPFERPAQQPLVVTRKPRSTPVEQPSTVSRPTPALPRKPIPQPLYPSQESEPEDSSEPVYIPMDSAYHSLSASGNPQAPKQSRRL
ncbi:hypothetical protein LARV_02743 [Longilinea arvoryzae]|uniref:Uncharacterized protein n=1 Tax=Longilinea arvoryzae TaxID=360412 RepID=A0A0S7BK24_9CHLR|nr:hypothetical protein [Longilinea arvoryzae]GAP14963.1 hypothetical protein LARV_02743 [Longilinea arvoryzae]